MFEAQPSQVSLIAAFLAGLVSFVSPCVLPLVPSYVTFITGLSFDELTAEPPNTDEEGDGWDDTETTRFGRYARRLWDFVLAHEAVFER